MRKDPGADTLPQFRAANPEKFHKRITVLSGDGAGSIYEALSSDARRGHGLAPLLWIFDELAQVQNPELLENLRTGMGKRRESLGIVISTQAEDDIVTARATAENMPLIRALNEGAKPQALEQIIRQRTLRGRPLALPELKQRVRPELLPAPRNVPAFAKGMTPAAAGDQFSAALTLGEATLTASSQARAAQTAAFLQEVTAAKSDKAGPSTTFAPSFDLRGSTLTEAQVQRMLGQALGAFDAQLSRSFGTRMKDFQKRYG